MHGEWIAACFVVVAICLVVFFVRDKKNSLNTLDNWSSLILRERTDQQEMLRLKDRVEQYEEKLAIYQKTMGSVLAQEVELTKRINQTNNMVMEHIAAGTPAAPWYWYWLGGDPQKMREEIGLPNDVDCSLTRLRTEDQGPKKINLSEKITKEDREKILEKLDRGDYRERCFG